MIWRWEQAIGIISMAIYFGYFISRKNKIAGLLAGWVLVSGAMVCWNPAIVNSIVDMRLRVISAKSIAYVSLLLFFVVSLSRKNLSKLFLFFEISILIEAILMALVIPGTFNADSMDAAFIATAYPILFRRRHWLPILVAIVTPFLLLLAPRLGNTMFMVLAAEAIGLSICYNWKAVLAVPFMGLGAWLAMGSSSFHQSDRIDNWKLFLTWLFDNGKEWFGAGTGLFQWIGPILQQRSDNLFTWAHNDWIQILIEQGFLGLGLSLALVFLCLKKSYKTPWLFATNLGFMACMLTQFPLRYFIGQLLAVTLIRSSLEEV